MKTNISETEYNKNIIKFIEIQSKIDILKIEFDIMWKKIEDRSIKEFTDIYTNEGQYPGVLNITSSNGSFPGFASLNLIPTNKYKDISKKQYNDLIKDYGNDIVSIDFIYTLDPALMSKYGELIIDFIKNSKDIIEKDIIKVVPRYEIKEGSICKLSAFCSNNRFTVPEMLKSIHPTYTLGSIKIDPDLDESNMI